MEELALDMDAGEPAAAGFDSMLRRARDGDTAAFEAILLRHERQVLGTAYRLLGRMEDAQDAAQEVFLRLYRHLKQFEDPRRLPPWLYRVTVNVCRDLGRSRRSSRLVALEDRQHPEAPPNAEADLAVDECRRLMMRALTMLPEKERAAVVLRDIEGLSTREVAEALGSSEATVRSQISTGRVKLKKFAARFLAPRPRVAGAERPDTGRGRRK